jgi:hypothetical protein
LVPTLEEASKLLKALGDGGYEHVSMGSPSPAGAAPTGALLDRAKSSLNRLNNWIVIALYKLGAAEQARAATAERVVSVLHDMPETAELFDSRGEGIVSRTISMVASSVLGDKFSWVAYERTRPRRFWLTRDGIGKARLLLGEKHA